MEIKIVSRGEVAEFRSSVPHGTLAVGMLLAGDRWGCVQQVVAAYSGEKVVGIATIAPDGEQNSGEPTIVALYVMAKYRSQGVGAALLEVAVDWMISERMTPIRIDSFNSKVTRMVARLPEEKQECVRLCDHANSIVDAMMEEV